MKLFGVHNEESVEWINYHVNKVLIARINYKRAGKILSVDSNKFHTTCKSIHARVEKLAWFSVLWFQNLHLRLLQVRTHLRDEVARRPGDPQRVFLITKRLLDVELSFTIKLLELRGKCVQLATSWLLRLSQEDNGFCPRISSRSKR